MMQKKNFLELQENWLEVIDIKMAEQIAEFEEETDNKG